MVTQEAVDQDLLRWLIEHARENEWQFRVINPTDFELRYCPYCCRKEDSGKEMKEHHPGCEYVAIMARTVGLGG